jgi:hypothetical protein
MKYECSSKGAYSFPLIIQNVVLETSTLQSLFFFLSFILFFRTEQVILEENFKAREQGIKSIEVARKGVLPSDTESPKNNYKKTTNLEWHNHIHE